FAFVGNLLLEVLDGQRGEVVLLVELPVDLQRALETGGAQDDASAFVAGGDFRRHRWHRTIKQRVGRVFRTAGGSSLLRRRGERRRCRQRDDHGDASQPAYSARRDHPGSLYARKKRGA